MLEVSKIEVVWCAPDVERLVETLVKVAHTGFQGDGNLFVTPVEQAIKVGTGDKNSKSLENSGETT